MPFVVETGEAVQQLVNAVIEDADFDATPAQALRWLNTRQKLMCQRTLCYRKTLALGNTVEAQDTYTLAPGVVRLLGVTVGDITYEHATHSDFSALAHGFEWLVGEPGMTGGVAGRDDTAAGTTQLRIFPVPGEAPLAIAVYAAMVSPDLVIGQDETLVIPAQFCDGLVDGAIATGSARGEARTDLAAQFEEKFTAACQELKLATRLKFRRSGPAQIRVNQPRWRG